MEPDSSSPPTRSGHPLFYKKLEEAANLHEMKNQDYADQTDPLGNFKRVAKMLNRLWMCPRCHESVIDPKMLPTVIALIYKTKQFDAEIEMLAKGKVAKVEGLEPRLMDQLVYSGLEMCLTEEARKPVVGQSSKYIPG